MRVCVAGFGDDFFATGDGLWLCREPVVVLTVGVVPAVFVAPVASTPAGGCFTGHQMRIAGVAAAVRTIAAQKMTLERRLPTLGGSCRS
jgi:hypothetical protein